MRHVKIKDGLEIKTTTGSETITDVLLRLDSLIVDFGEGKCYVRVSAFLNNNENALPIKTVDKSLNEIELDINDLTPQITNIVLNKIAKTYNCEKIINE